jgi:hypothetical protein
MKPIEQRADDVINTWAVGLPVNVADVLRTSHVKVLRLAVHKLLREVRDEAVEDCAGWITDPSQSHHWDEDVSSEFAVRLARIAGEFRAALKSTSANPPEEE